MRTTPLAMCGNYSCVDGVVVGSSMLQFPHEENHYHVLYIYIQFDRKQPGTFVAEAADTTLDLVSYELALVRSLNLQIS